MNRHGNTGLRSDLTGEVIRFVLVRGVCTVLSYGLYLVLLGWTRYEVAYGAAFVFGIVLAYVVNALFVFRQPMRKRSALQFPLVYLLQFVATLVVLRVSVEYLGITEAVALAIAIAITLPATFLLSRWVLRQPADGVQTCAIHPMSGTVSVSASVRAFPDPCDESAASASSIAAAGNASPCVAPQHRCAHVLPHPDAQADPGLEERSSRSGENPARRSDAPR